MAKNETQKYVVNMDFGHGTLGEVIEAEPKLVADWEAGGFISPIDDAGNRLVKLGRKEGVDEGATPVDVSAPRAVTKDDVAPDA